MRTARELLKDLEYEVVCGSVDRNVNELVYNTAKVTKDSSSCERYEIRAGSFVGGIF